MNILGNEVSYGMSPVRQRSQGSNPCAGNGEETLKDISLPEM